MNIETSIALDGLSILYMIILIVNLGHKSKKAILDYQYFWIMILVCAFIALDGVYYLFYGKSGIVYQHILKSVKSVYFILNCAVIWLWAKYIDYTIFGKRYKQKKHRMIYTAVFIINVLLVVINCFTDFMFGISLEGRFVVGSIAIWIFTLLNYFTVIMITVIILLHRQNISKNVFLPLLFFPLPPFLAEIIQIYYREFSLVGTYSISALIVFQIAQNNAIYTDQLTGLANRRLLMETLSDWLSESKGTRVCGIMIDLDHLKKINDTFGHLAGDNAIIHMAEIIKSIHRKDILTTRYGGDEFVLIWQSDSENEILEIQQNLESNKVKFNQSWPEQERIDFSLGDFCCLDSDSYSVEEFIRQMDQNMYRAKKVKRTEGIYDTIG